MYYELYVDVLFLINMFADYLLLLLVKHVLKCNTGHFRMFMGSIIGGIGICLLVMLPAGLSGLVYPGHALLGILMVKTGCRLKGWKSLLKGVAVLYGAAFLFSGAFQALAYYTSMNRWLWAAFLEDGPTAMKVRTFLLISGISYILISLLLRLFEDYRNRISNIYEITLYQKGKSRRATAFLDTGNQLKDPLTGKPVSIIDYGTLEMLLDPETMKQVRSMLHYESGTPDSGREDGPGKRHKLSGIHYIPYHSVGKERGILPGVTIDIMSIRCKGETIVVRNPVLAVSGHGVSAKSEYQIILNPAVLDQP